MSKKYCSLFQFDGFRFSGVHILATMKSTYFPGNDSLGLSMVHIVFVWFTCMLHTYTQDSVLIPTETNVEFGNKKKIKFVVCWRHSGNNVKMESTLGSLSFHLDSLVQEMCNTGAIVCVCECSCG